MFEAVGSLAVLIYVAACAKQDSVDVFGEGGLLAQRAGAVLCPFPPMKTAVVFVVPPSMSATRSCVSASAGP